MVALDAEVPQSHMGLVDVPAGLVDHVDARRGLVGGGRDLACLLRLGGPAGCERLVQPAHQVVRVEVAGRCDDEARRVVVVLVELLQGLARDGLDGVSRWRAAL